MIERFIKAQNKVYDRVIKELKNGKKVTHWMWYIFPQIKGLGFSDMSIYYSINSKEEFSSYINNEILYNRYLECCKILLNLDSYDIEDILGDIDSIKLKSSLTLFYTLDNKNKPLYKDLLDKYYDGLFDNNTLDILEYFD